MAAHCSNDVHACAECASLSGDITFSPEHRFKSSGCIGKAGFLRLNNEFVALWQLRKPARGCKASFKLCMTPFAKRVALAAIHSSCPLLALGSCQQQRPEALLPVLLHLCLHLMFVSSLSLQKADVIAFCYNGFNLATEFPSQEPAAEVSPRWQARREEPSARAERRGGCQTASGFSRSGGFSRFSCQSASHHAQVTRSEAAAVAAAAVAFDRWARLRHQHRAMPSGQYWDRGMATSSSWNCCAWNFRDVGSQQKNRLRRRLRLIV